MKRIALVALFLYAIAVSAQDGPRVLFIGNSYTEVNNLPQMVFNIANSMGDNMTYSSNTPGGCTFSQHCTNQSMQLICQGGWDVVVLQEQSQYPSFPQSQVEAEVFPYAERLVDSIYAHNPCAEPMFYMTWGRRDGDQNNAPYFPVLGTYEGMDSMLCLRYTYMAEANDASLCPVGRVWRYLRTNYPSIDLYASDGSHPSVAGTYAAACAFYTLIFHRDPSTITFNASLYASEASTIRSAVHNVVYNNLSQWQRPMPVVELQLLDTINSNTVWFRGTPQHADSLYWNFGDGTDTTTSANSSVAMQHIYSDSGIYTVTLTATRHCLTVSDTITTTDSTLGPFTLSVYSDNYSMGYVLGSGTYNYSSNVNIIANANNGYHFVQWDDGDTNCNRTVTIIGDTAYTAFFAPNQYRLTLHSNNPSFGSVSGGGEYIFQDTVTISANANYGYHFAQWNDGDTNNNRTITLICDTTFTAFFAPNPYHITLQSNNPNIGSVSGGGVYNLHDTVTITATAVEHYHFVYWIDSVYVHNDWGEGYSQINYNTENPRQIVVSGDATYTAYFAIDTHSVIVQTNNIARGMVEASGTEFVYGTPCTITATAYSGYTFAGWSNGVTYNPYTFAVLGDVELTALFIAEGEDIYTVTVVSDDPTMGIVSGGGQALYGDDVTIRATAFNGYRFVRWNDNDTHDVRTITVTADATYTAYFESTTQGIDVADKDDLKVYTTGGRIYVSVGGEAVKDYRVYDLMGREVFHATNANEQSALTGGIYLVKVGILPAHKIVVIR